VSSIVSPSDGAAALNMVSEFDQGLLTRLRGGAVIAPDTWAKYVGSGRKVTDKHQPAVLLCGSSVTQGTQDVLLEWTAQHETRDAPATGMLWLRPCVTHWGRNADFWELAEVLGTRTPVGAGLTLVTGLRSSGLNHAELRKFMPSAEETGPFLRGYGTRNDDLPGALEILLYPGRWVAVLVHLPMGADGPPVPIGFCSAVPDVVRGAQVALSGRLLPYRADDRVLWKPKNETDVMVREIMREALAASP
jgi:hypothetical protein